MTEADNAILNALRERLAKDGHSARRVARLLSVHQAVILDWLTGRRRPRRATLERIAALLKAR